MHALGEAWRWDACSPGFHRLPGATRLCKNVGRPIWRVFFGGEAQAAREAELGRGSVPGTSVASLCVRPRIDRLLAPTARWLSVCTSCTCWRRRQAARQSGRARHGALGRALESFTLLARGGRALLPRTSPVFSRGESRRHFAVDNEILAANCSRGRCPSGKAREEASKCCLGRRAREGEGGTESRQLLLRLPEAH